MRCNRLFVLLSFLLILPACDGGGGTLDTTDPELGDVMAGDVEAGSVSAGDVIAGDVTAGLVSAGDVAAGGVSAGLVSAGDVAAGSVSAGDVNAGDVLAGDVEATGSVTVAGDISVSVLGSTTTVPGLAIDVASLDFVWTGFSADPASAWITASAGACLGGVPRQMVAIPGANLGELGILVAVDCNP